MNVKDYLNLIPSANANQPNFNAVVTASVSIPVQVQNLLTSMLPLFDIGTPPVGNQLDILGQWIGVTRNVVIPASGVYFTWDVTGVGWDVGIWPQSGSPGSITVLPDQAYLVLLLTEIAANSWDGTIDGAYTVWNDLLARTGIQIFIEDYQNMTYALGIIGSSIPALTQALITGGYINLRPEGVKVTNYFIGTVPMFAWDTNNANFKGWDQGKWSQVVYT